VHPTVCQLIRQHNKEFSMWNIDWLKNNFCCVDGETYITICISWGKTRETSVRITGVPTENRTGSLLNTSYGLRRLSWWSVSEHKHITTVVNTLLNPHKIYSYYNTIHYVIFSFVHHLTVSLSNYSLPNMAPRTPLTHVLSLQLKTKFHKTYDKII
jgi:hypothetical protein